MMWSILAGRCTMATCSGLWPMVKLRNGLDGKTGTLDVKGMLFLANHMHACDSSKCSGRVWKKCAQSCAAILQHGTRRTWSGSTVQRCFSDDTCMLQGPTPARKENTVMPDSVCPPELVILYMFLMQFSCEKLLYLSALTGFFSWIATVWLHMHSTSFYLNGTSVTTT